MTCINNPYSQMLLSAVPDFFYGRQGDVQTILQGVSGGNQPRSFSLQGARMIGKTTLLRYLTDARGATLQSEPTLLEYGPNRKGELIFVYIDFYKHQGDMVISDLLSSLLRNKRVLNAIDPTTKEDNQGSDPSEMKAKIRDIQEILLSKNIRLAICLDHFDQAFESMAYEDDVFLRSLSSYSALIIATEKSLSELRLDPHKTSPLLTILVRRVLGLLAESEARDLILSPLKDTGIEFSHQEVDFLLKVAGFHPYLLSLVGEFWFELRTRNPDDTLVVPNREIQRPMRLQLASLPPVAEFFKLIWGHLSTEEQEALYKIANNVVDDASFVLNNLIHKSLLTIDLKTGSYALFSDAFQVFVLQEYSFVQDHAKGNVMDLPQLEKRLLDYLIDRPGKLCSFDELLRAVWQDPNASKRALEAAVHRLRNKLKIDENDDWDYIQSVRGKGYVYKPKTRSSSGK